MKSFLTSISAAFLTGISMIAPAKAITYIPEVVAPAYCLLRSRGVDHNSALYAAADYGHTAGNNWYYVYYGGVRMQSDIAQTTALITTLCPQYLR